MGEGWGEGENINILNSYVPPPTGGGENRVIIILVLLRGL